MSTADYLRAIIENSMLQQPREPIQREDGPRPGELLTEDQAAGLAGVSKKTLRRLIKSGRLQAKDYGTGSRHNYRIDPTALASLNNAGPQKAANTASKPAPPHRRFTPRSACAKSQSALLPQVSAGAKGTVKRPLTRA